MKDMAGYFKNDLGDYDNFYQKEMPALINIPNIKFRTELPLQSSYSTSSALAIGSTIAQNIFLNTSSIQPGADDYYYDYDYDESVSKLPLIEILPVALIYSLTFLVGLVGNSLVIFSVTKFHKMRNVTNIFLTSLASADLLLILICVPIKLIAFMSFTWKLGAFLCKFVYYMQNVSVICSVLTLTAMSLERYYAIKYPLKAKIFSTLSQAKLVIIIVWMVSFLLAIPIIFGRQHIEVGVVRKGYWCVQSWSKRVYSIIYEVFQLSLLLLLPVLVMMFAYCSIAHELRSVRLHKLSLQNSSGGSSRSLRAHQLNKSNTGDEKQVHKQVIQMLVLILTLYVVCWSPILINNVLAAVGVVPELHIGHWKYVRQAFYLTSYLNSCINPIVYAFVSKTFRDSFKMAVLACFRGKAHVRRHIYSKRFSWSSRRQNTLQTTTHNGNRSSTVRNNWYTDDLKQNGGLTKDDNCCLLRPIHNKDTDDSSNVTKCETRYGDDRCTDLVGVDETALVIKNDATQTRHQNGDCEGERTDSSEWVVSCGDDMGDCKRFSYV